MGKRRIARLNEQFKREIAVILRREVRDPRVGTVTVTGVEVTPDLYSARVWVRLTGEPGDRQETLQGLEAAAPYIRRILGEDLHIRRVPELDFREDDTLKRAMRIEEILDEVLPEEEEGKGEAVEGRESPVTEEEDPGA